MNYQIIYNTKNIDNIRRVNKYRKLPVYICTVTVIILAVIIFSNPNSLSAVRDYLVPGNDAVTKSAFFELTENIKEGESMSAAITTFCQRVIGNAAP